ncbi:aldo/keto reductase [Streptomyces europaeiscabiei]|uniref:Aldo/keto reductase n=1 Tax=Streptomyces europaeiscabiei TaxID=146819 RepID=A0ABU4NMC6_9ACTN|nr:aldo/keto reductase [Streptomyces europaeiscabiei]MDX2525133.1 aldo/keto reductase [Streptomyces europaeiscabiei]MDX2759016.1 aldo/keto reductase [Streptomyces europaeiscabiei]MDX2768644.1 aldo/keto reductase [Streptomyces europaeiscabiei]MDX3546897.1 aldo/keto reductase [Streptomyces europaeiscabiei]MDX3556590.1 aldo/keto reductase [Streptomyces europaeiscabiei]
MPFARLAAATTPTCHLGLGLAAVARPGYINLGRDADLGATRTVEALRTRTHELLDAAHAQGVRYFDVARSYGLSEEFLADWLKARPGIDDIVVGSKWGYTYTADWTTDAERHEVKDHSLQTFERQRVETRDLLGDRLDLYQIHSVTPDSPALTDKELHARLAQAAAEGVTVGFSTSGPAQAEAIRTALAVTVDGEPLFRTVQSTYNALETSAAPALAEAHDAGLTVIVKEGMANGRLAGPHAPDALRTVAEQTGLGCDAVALAVVLRQPWAGVVLSGAATTAQLASNLHAAVVDLDDEQLTGLTGLVEDPRTYWEKRGQLPWH